MDLKELPFTIADLRRLYLERAITVEEVIQEALRRAGQEELHPHVWIRLLTSEEVAKYVETLDFDRIHEFPLFGIPFAIKDNIDLDGVPTTCACPDFSFTPSRSAKVVELLIAAGAIPIGKTNMDQFATGLVGVRSPYGACQSVFDPRYVSGGSSSGSGVAVAAGMVAFSLGTDTAGSGRVPAAFNNIVGLKPSRGIFSNTGLYPACRSLDCISVFAGSCADAETVLRLAAVTDEEDPYSRPLKNMEIYKPGATDKPLRFGIPSGEYLRFFGDEEAANLYAHAVDRMEKLGHTCVEIDFEPFAKSAVLLYAGPWVAERRAALGDFFLRKADAMDPTVRGIVARADGVSAVEAFEGVYALQALAAAAQRQWQSMDFLLLPTTGTTYTIEQVQAEPVKLNSNLGYYTNFVNLLDLAAVAVPAGFRKSPGLPFGVTLMGPALTDSALLSLADQFHRSFGGNIGITSAEISYQPRPAKSQPVPETRISVAVVGAHLSGQPLNHQLTSRGGKLVRTTKTASCYRLYALAHTTPAKPGLRRMDEAGSSLPGAGIEVEIWSLSVRDFGSFTAEVAAPMAIGTLEMEDGSWVKGFVCEPLALESAE
ncbi:MAG TPA: allophanate hydrolase, partial [Candidatus Methylacidiphilales bacterium]|nr:allophanate hydrolase [Candidatus Methylacidiphilales bacterium]